jgi:NitT/TauT family transport system substrate-binding protein
MNVRWKSYGALLGTLFLAVIAFFGVGPGIAAASSSIAKTSPQQFTLAVVPYSGLAATGVGQVKGIFAHYGLQVSLKPASNIDIIIAELQSGQVPVGYLSTAIMLNAVEKGVPLVCVAPVGPLTKPIPNYPGQGIIVAKSSPIKSLAQLDGKTLALPTLSGANYLAAKAGVSEAGANWNSIKLTALPYADMNAAVHSGEVDAAFQLSPYIEQGEKAGETRLLKDLSSIGANSTGACWGTTQSYLNQHKKILRNFNLAMDQAILYSEKYPAVAEAQIPRVSGVPASSLAGTLPPKFYYTDSLLPNRILQYERFMKKWGGLEGNIIPLKRIVWIAPGTPMTKLYFNGNGKFIG